MFTLNAALLCLATLAAASEPVAAFRTEHMGMSIAPNGHVVQLLDRATGTCLLRSPKPMASIEYAGTVTPATTATHAGDEVVLRFGDLPAVARLNIEEHGTHLLIEVAGLDDPEDKVQALQFLNVHVRADEISDDPFECSALAMNLRTLVPAIPGAMQHLAATAHPRFGMEGASVALVGARRSSLRDLLKQVVSTAGDIPTSPIGGPWALDADENRKSYLIALGKGVTEDNVEDWIEVAERTGARQINFHAGESMRFGDYEPNPEHYPNGMDGLRAVVGRLRNAGITAGLHTYAQFIAKDTPWVTPVPDPRLAYDKAFTLARDISAEATTVPVIESTEDRSPITGFQVRNSATLRIGEELVVFHDVDRTPPYAFSEVERGALGTTASDHAAGAKVYHLKECFGLFAPDGDSTLYAEVAARTAHVYNTCGFGMIYLDAIDGSDVIAGPENAWHYGARFIHELNKRLERPALFEMSAFWHHFWFVRSRMGAWDASARGIKPFVDMHVIANRDTERMFLPSNLGWLALFSWHALQPERTLPDHMEYLLCKALAYDSSLSLLYGFSPDVFFESELAQRKAEMIRRYEELRLGDEVPAAIRERLAVLGDEFTLEESGPTGRQFTPIAYEKHTFTGESGDSWEWRAHNPYGRQPVRLRIEALPGLEPYDDPAAVTLAAFDGPGEFADFAYNDGVESTVSVVPESLHGMPGARFAGRSTRAEPDTAWTRVTKTFDPPVDMRNRGVGTWVHGDGSGALLNIQIRSPHHLGGGQANRYVDLDFEGWRYLELVELEGDRIVDYEWPDMRRRHEWEEPDVNLMMLAYPTLHIHVAFQEIETMSLFLNNIEPGQEVECRLAPIRALPVQDRVLRNPAVTINGETIVFPVDLRSGYYIEYRSMEDCRVYDRRGALTGMVEPRGAVPEMERGENLVRMSAEEASGRRVRARLTVMSTGDPLPF